MSERTTFSEVARWGAIIVGMVLSFALAVVLVAQAPPYVLLTIVVLVFLGWLGVKTGYLADEDGADEATRDPLTVLQERYAAGEISESEFERRLEHILETDELARRSAESGRKSGSKRQLEPEHEFEREQ